MSTWVTVQEACLLTGRKKSAIYVWAGNGTVRKRNNARGQMVLHGQDVLEADKKVHIGRPKGSASRNIRNATRSDEGLGKKTGKAG